MRLLSAILCVTTLINVPFVRAADEPEAEKPTTEQKRFTPEEVAKILRLIDAKKIAKKKKQKRSKNFKRYLMLLLVGIGIEISLEAFFKPSEWMRNRVHPDKIPPAPAPAADLTKANADILALQEALAAHIAAQEKVPAQQQQIYEQLLEARLTEPLKKLRDLEACLAALQREAEGQKNASKKNFAALGERVDGAEHRIGVACNFAKQISDRLTPIETNVEFHKRLNENIADQKKKTSDSNKSGPSPSASSSNDNLNKNSDSAT